MVDDRAPAERCNDERHRLMPGAHGARLGQMPRHPADLRRHVGGVEHQPGTAADQVGIDAGDLGLRAAVHPDDARRERLAVVVDRHAAVELARDGDAFDVSGLEAGGGERPRNGRLQRAQPQARILLGPARRGKVRLIGTLASPRRTRSESTTTAFRLWVPRSMPMTGIVRPSRSRRGHPEAARRWNPWSGSRIR